MVGMVWRFHRQTKDGKERDVGERESKCTESKQKRETRGNLQDMAQCAADKMHRIYIYHYVATDDE